MKAAICYEFGQPLRVEEVEIDAPRKGEVKVRLAATGICHSDVHLIRGEWGGDLPVVAGHEAAGVVEEVGDDVTLTQPGDRVVVSLIRSCGRCFYCAMGSPQQCEGMFALETESRLHTRRGEPLRQGLLTAAFAEYTIVDQSQVVPVPDDMPLDRAALLACGVITGVGAVTNIARVTPGSSVVVIGLGGVGLNAVQGAVLAGAYPIIALDVLDTKLTAARTFGATHTVNAGWADVRAVVKDLTDGRRADYVFVTVGSPAAVAQGLTLVRREGTVAIVGIPQRGANVPLGIAELVLTGKRVIGCLMGATRLQVDVPRLVALYQQGRLKLDELITARYQLEQINEAIAVMERGEALRNVIVFAPDA
jgi:S-(hydroxymethyl)glutathione dehydrogenase / alcohol dehydrogenase